MSGTIDTIKIKDEKDREVSSLEQTTMLEHLESEANTTDIISESVTMVMKQENDESKLLNCLLYYN